MLGYGGMNSLFCDLQVPVVAAMSKTLFVLISLKRGLIGESAMRAEADIEKLLKKLV